MYRGSLVQTTSGRVISINSDLVGRWATQALSLPHASQTNPDRPRQRGLLRRDPQSCLQHHRRRGRRTGPHPHNGRRRGQVRSLVSRQLRHLSTHRLDVAPTEQEAGIHRRSPHAYQGSLRLVAETVSLGHAMRANLRKVLAIRQIALRQSVELAPWISLSVRNPKTNGLAHEIAETATLKSALRATTARKAHPRRPHGQAAHPA